MGRQCTVNWEAPAAPIVDMGSFERKPETGYVNTDTNDDETDANTDTKEDQTNTYPETNAVKITQQTYTDDNSKLTSEDTDTYVDEASADIVKDNVDTSAPY